jgi:hypothetical protein
MSRKIYIKDLRKICGGKQQGIGYKESSRHIYELIDRLSDIGFIEKADTEAKPPFKYKVASHEFVISLED